MDTDQWEQGPAADQHEHGNESLGFTDVPDQRNEYPVKTSYDVSKLTVTQSMQPDRNNCTDHPYYYSNTFCYFLKPVGRPLAEFQVQHQASPCGICAGQSGIGRGFSASTVVLPYIIPQMLRTHSFFYHRRWIILATNVIHCGFTLHHSTNASHSVIRLSSTLNNLSNQRHSLRFYLISFHKCFALIHSSIIDAE